MGCIFQRGDVPLFEKISLEGAQSGLSWLTILRKRNAYRHHFHGFDIDKVAKMIPEDIESILSMKDEDNPRNLVVRHRGKLESIVNNAKCIQRMMQLEEKNEENKKNGKGNQTIIRTITTKEGKATKNHGTFDAFLWSFVDDKPILNRWNGKRSDMDAQSPESREMSKALKKLGFRFVGPTTCYAMMQSVGMVIDHPADSPEWKASHERLQARPGGYQKR